jgi:FkbH-like protein
MTSSDPTLSPDWEETLLSQAQAHPALLDLLDDTALAERLGPWLPTVNAAPTSPLARTLVNRLTAPALAASPQLDPWLLPGSSWRQSPLGEWCTATALATRNQPIEVIAMLDPYLRRVPSHREAHWLRARCLRQTGAGETAWGDLKEAARPAATYGFLTKVAALFDRLAVHATPPACQTLNVALLSSSTTELLAPLLRLIAFREGLFLRVYQPPFGSIGTEVLNLESGLYAHRPDVVLLLTHWRDAHLPELAENPTAEVERVYDETASRWTILRKRLGCTIIQNRFDFPTEESSGLLSSSHSGGRIRLLRRINTMFEDRCPEGVVLADLPAVQSRLGAKAWVSTGLWLRARQHPGAEALPALVEHYVGLLKAVYGFSKKVIVTDLDDTLWGGVIGEDGMAGIQVGPPSAIGEAFAAFQTYLAGLKRRGILLAVCSKNNESDARQPFTEHDGMVLKLDDFVMFVANWRDKPANLREIAGRLNLGLDSFVFVDDNPVERAHVRQELPDVAVVELPADPADYVAAIEEGGYFPALRLSDEDQRRHKTYAANFRREEWHQTTASVDEYLVGLQMKATSGPVDDATFDRVHLLVGKTNQFNLTTRRHTPEQLRALLADTRSWARWFRLQDQFGDNGLVGVILAQGCSYHAQRAWAIDTLVMSCRVLGRGLEQLMLNTLAAAARQSGALHVIGQYIPTAKNAVVADLLPRFGFVPCEPVLGDAGQTYRLTLDTFIPLPHHIADNLVACTQQG